MSFSTRLRLSGFLESKLAEARNIVARYFLFAQGAGESFHRDQLSSGPKPFVNPARGPRKKLWR